MTGAASRFATYEDLLALPEDTRAEVLSGHVVALPGPSPRHSRAQGALRRLIGGPYDDDDGRGGPGGWWILIEVDVRLAPHDIVRPDLAGWRRERLPSPWDERPIEVAPDWIGEVISSHNSRDCVGLLGFSHGGRWRRPSFSRTTSSAACRSSMHLGSASQSLFADALARRPARSACPERSSAQPPGEHSEFRACSANERGMDSRGPDSRAAAPDGVGDERGAVGGSWSAMYCRSRRRKLPSSRAPAPSLRIA